MKSKQSELTILAYLIASALFIIIVFLMDAWMLIFAITLVIFDRCLFGRIKVIRGIEFTTLALIIVALKYDLVLSIPFAIIVPTVLPTIINSFIGDKFIINRAFKMTKGGFGVIANILTIFLVGFLTGLNLIIIAAIVLAFRHILYYLKIKVTEASPYFDELGIVINIIFNLLIAYILLPIIIV